MLPYVAVTAGIALMAFVAPDRRNDRLLWAAAFVTLAVFVGLRHHVGMDWNNYFYRLQVVSLYDPRVLLSNREPGYDLLLWISGQLGWGLYLPNFVGALIFLLGLFRYARTTPSPWIALLVAMPYLVIAVSMSGARQTIAIGILLLATASWHRSSLWTRVACVLVASLFHVSAAGFMVLTVRDLKIAAWAKIALGGVFAAVAAYLLMTTEAAESYSELYVTGEDVVVSGGALMHVLLNAGPALVYFALPARYREILLPNALHRDLAVLAIALIPASYLASTAASRVSLYVFPVSMYIFAALPLILRGKGVRAFIRYAGAIGFVGLAILWLAAANNSYAWLPYRNLLTEPAHELELCCRAMSLAGAG